MNTLTSTALQFTDQVQRLSTVIGLLKSSPQDRLFLVMGKTGSGKSTFIARCTGVDVTVGHGLYSCTDSIDTYSYTIPNPHNHLSPRRIHLIDTPGFDDTTRPDTETLSILASYLGASYANGLHIHGIIMLHPITDNRMTGSSMRNLQIMRKMCGFASWDGLAIATTMWRDSGGSLREKGRAVELGERERELFTDPRFYGDLVGAGAAVFRHNEGGRRDGAEEARSARRIVGHLVGESDRRVVPLTLRIQWEMIDEGKTLGETTAGIAIAGDLYKERREHELQLREIESELRSRLARTDSEHAAELQSLRADLQRQVGRAEDENRALQKRIGELHDGEEEAWLEKVRIMDEEFREQIKAKEEELEELEESIREIQEDARSSAGRSRWSGSFQDQDYSSEHVAIVNTARREVVEAKDSHDRLQSQTGNIINGIANGVSAGLTTSVVSGALAGGLLCIVM